MVCEKSKWLFVCLIPTETLNIHSFNIINWLCENSYICNTFCTINCADHVSTLDHVNKCAICMLTDVTLYMVYSIVNYCYTDTYKEAYSLHGYYFCRKVRM